MLNIKREKDLKFKRLKDKIDLSKHNIFIEDNIHILNELKRQKKQVNVIYIDPPYNTRNNDLKYKDNLKVDEWVSFIYERLVLAQEILSEDGVILVSINDNYYAYLKLIMDEIFGINNFIANFIWKKIYSIKNDKIGICTQQEYVLCFSKNIKKVFANKEPISEDYIKKAYRYEDEKGRYRLVQIHKEKNKNKYEITAPNGKKWEKGWNLSKESMQKLIDNDLIYYGKDGNACPSKKLYMKEKMEKTYNSMIPTSVGYTGDGRKDLIKLGFHSLSFMYAKPVKLIEYLISIFSKEDSVIMDFFAGSGTTGEAVINKNIEDNGNRIFILATNNENKIAEEITIPRIKKVFKKNKIKEEYLDIYKERDFH